jgi:hypothetical protein
VISEETKQELFNAVATATRETLELSAESGLLKAVSDRFGALGVRYSIVVSPEVSVLIEEESGPVVDWHSDGGKKA